MRLDRDTCKELAVSLTRNKSRSILTGFGIFWGIFMLLSLMGGSHGLKSIVSSTLEGFATNSAFLAADRTSRDWQGFQAGRSWNLTNSDVDMLKANISGISAVSVMYSRWSNNSFSHDGLTYSGIVKGLDPSNRLIKAPKIVYGRFINEMDMRQERKVCVIGKKVYERLFPGGGDPCGEYVCVGNTYFQVIGVDESTSDVSIDGPMDESVAIPSSVFARIYNRGDSVDLLCFLVEPGCKAADILKQAKILLARKHVFDPEDEAAVMMLDTEKLFQLVDGVMKGIAMLVLLIGIGTLLAAAVGVSNIMMVTVRERTIEIGIRRAIGATPRMILSQIMSESMILTLVFGAIGIMASVGLLALSDIAMANAGREPVFQIGFGLSVAALGIILVLGLLAGLMPSLRAMAIKPVDAMRDE